MQTILVAVLGGINPDGGFGNIPGIAFAVIIFHPPQKKKLKKECAAEKKT